MGRQDPVVAAQRVAGEQGEGVGVDHQRTPAVERRTQQIQAPRAAPEAGADRDDVGPPQQRPQVGGRTHPVAHQLGARGGQRRGMPRPGRDGDQASSGAQRRTAGKQDRAGHPRLAPDHQHPAVVALVAVAPPPRQPPRQVAVVEQRRDRFDPGVDPVGQVEAGEPDLAGVIGPLRGEQAGLLADEGDGRRGTNRAAERHAAPGVEPRRDVQREHLGAGVVDRPDGVGPGPLDRPLQPGAEQRVDHDIRPLQGRLSERQDLAAAGPPVVGRGRGVAAQPVRVAEVQQGHLAAVGPREPGDDVAVTAVVAAATDDRDPPCPRPAPGELGVGGGAGAGHQLVTGDTVALDRRPVETADLGRAVQGEFRRRVHAAILSRS